MPDVTQSCTTMFTTTAGDPLSFYLDLSVPEVEVERVRRLIYCFGGFTVRSTSGMDQYTVHLVDEVTSVNRSPLGSPMFYYKFVDDCVAQNRLLNLKDYLAFNVPVFAQLDFQKVVLDKTEPMRYCSIKDLYPRRCRSSNRLVVLSKASVEVVSGGDNPGEVKAHLPIVRKPCRTNSRQSSMEIIPSSPDVPLDKTESQSSVNLGSPPNENVPRRASLTANPTEPSAITQPDGSPKCHSPGKHVDLPPSTSRPKLTPSPDRAPSKASTDIDGLSSSSAPPSARDSIQLSDNDDHLSDSSNRKHRRLATVAQSPSSLRGKIVLSHTDLVEKARANLDPPPSVRHVRQRDFNTRSSYTHDEKTAILRHLLSLPRHSSLRGNTVWKDMEELGVCPTRSYQSLKNHFLKTLVHELDWFPFLTDEEKKWLRNRRL